MFLKSVEIFGFKSFPKKTGIRLDTGITALVGPNGCGKTNIVDAIRWALGEQRPNVLRCDRMDEIIFGGTQTRKALGLAEVTLTFVNDGKFPLDFEEVEVTRRSSRSGESEYLLNRTPCRHKDIVDLFLNTGLSSRAYSLITIDMVDRILDSDPQLRRNFFEEAAGIAKYRARRNLTLRKLSATEDDLLRVNDIILEIERTCRSLKRQAGKARSYQRLKQELKEVETFYLLTKFDELRKARESLEAQKVKLEREQDCKMEDLATRQEDFQRRKEELKEKETAYSALLSRLEKTRDEATGIERDLAMFRERKKSLEENLDRLGKDRSEIEKRIPGVEEQIEAAVRELQQLARTIGEVETKLKQKDESLRVGEKEVSSMLLKRDDLADKVTKMLAAENDKRKIYLVLEAQREVHIGKADALSSESRDLANELRLLSWHLYQGISQVDWFSKNLKSYEARLGQLKRSIEDWKSSSGALAQRERELRQKALTARSELDLLKVFEERMEGHERSARAILGRKKQTSIRTTVADCIEVPDEYVQAIEGALGIGLSTLITEDETDVINSIEFLMKNKKGRAVFAPLSLLRSTSTSQMPASNSVIGLASNFVKCKRAYEPVIKALLDNFLLCRDLRTAFELFKSGAYSQYYLLTKSGEVIEPNGIVRGGSPSQQPLLGRKRRIQSLEKNVVALEKYRNNVEHELLKKEVHTQKLQAEFARLDEAYQEEIRKRVDLDSWVSTTKYAIKNLEESLAKLDQERRHGDRELQRTGKRKGEVEKEIEGITSERESIQLNLSSIEEELSSKREAVRKTSSEVESERMELLKLRMQHDRLRDDLAREESSVGMLREQLKKREEEKSQIAVEIENTESLLGENENLNTAINVNKAALQSEISELESRKRERQKRIEESENETELISLELKSHQEKIQDLRIRLMEVETRGENLKERASEELGLDLDEVRESEKVQVDEDQLETLRTKIAALEPVNMLAFKEFEEADARLKHLVSQKADLTEAKDSLKKTLRKMDQMARSKFMDTYQKVQGHFKEIFSEVFDGGQADLCLEGDSDPLRSEIQIVASPGGKRLTRIDLLSSGERALVAISLLFAIFLVRPSPFYILDEIDAPLDDVNISRFIKLLTRMSRKSQIALITHNKRTMEAANSLYGITMEEAGVTKVVSVRLREEEAEFHTELAPQTR